MLATPFHIVRRFFFPSYRREENRQYYIASKRPDIKYLLVRAKYEDDLRAAEQLKRYFGFGPSDYRNWGIVLDSAEFGISAEQLEEIYEQICWSRYTKACAALTKAQTADNDLEMLERFVETLSTWFPRYQKLQHVEPVTETFDINAEELLIGYQTFLQDVIDMWMRCYSKRPSEFWYDSRFSRLCYYAGKKPEDYGLSFEDLIRSNPQY